MSDSPPRYAFATLVTSDYYLPGALVVAAALRELHPSPPSHAEELDPHDFHIICLVSPETVSVQTLKLLRKTFDVVIGVEIIEADNEEALKLLGRPDLKSVLTKLHVFRLKSYRKIIYLDADVLPLLPLSHLFHRVSSFAAVPDIGWPDIFNSGVLVFTPEKDDFDQIMTLVNSQGSWDGGDQGILNEWRGNNWERLSFTYNTTPTGAYTYAPAYKRFGSGIKAIHFIGPNKPWSKVPFRAPISTHSIVTCEDTPSDENSAYDYASLLDRWFFIFDKYYRSTSPMFTTTGSLMPDATFIEGIYKNAWNSGDSIRDGRPNLGLEELKRLALEGLGQSPTIGVGEGIYMTLPLAGRLDLMPLRRSHFGLPPPQLSHSSTSSSDSHAEKPLDGLLDSSSSVSVSTGSEATSDMSVRWDPWMRPYPNAWDLFPSIVQRYACHSMFPKERVRSSGGMGKSQKDTNIIHSRRMDKEETTSTDGDDEAED